MQNDYDVYYNTFLQLNGKMIGHILDFYSIFRRSFGKIPFSDLRNVSFLTLKVPYT